MPEVSSAILQPHPRPDAKRVLIAPMMMFDLPAIIESIKQEKDWALGKHTAITLMKSASMRIVLIAIHKGNEISTHQTEGPISVHIIEGRLQFTIENESIVLEKGQLLSLQENIQHGLNAIEKTIFLLTMVNLKANQDDDVNDHLKKQMGFV